jgi:hypothetical protein
MSELIPSQARLWALELDRLSSSLGATDWKRLEKARRAAAEKYEHRTHPIVSSLDQKRLGVEFWFGDGSRAAMYYDKPGAIVFDESMMVWDGVSPKRVESGPSAHGSQHEKLDLVVVEDRSRK